MTESDRSLDSSSESKKTLGPDSFWAKSGLYLLWNKLFPRFSVRLETYSWSICDCSVDQVLDGVRVEIVSVVFTPDVTVLGLEFTLLDETTDMLKLHPWNTTVELRKCVNKNLRVSQVSKVNSIELHPGESKRAYTAHRSFKLSSRLRWIDVFISVRREQGQFIEKNFRISREILTRSLSKKTFTALENLASQLVNAGLLLLYILSFVVGSLVSTTLSLSGLTWYYETSFLIVVTLSCAVLLRWQFAKALANMGYEHPLSVRALIHNAASVFDPITRGREKRKWVSTLVQEYLESR
jgi:hypothetical protein